jgi:hypothetical protein
MCFYYEFLIPLQFGIIPNKEAVDNDIITSMYLSTCSTKVTEIFHITKVSVVFYCNQTDIKS